MNHRYLLLVLISIFLSSCAKNNNLGSYWGEANTYDDFFVKKYIPTPITKTMSFEFNEDAKVANSSVTFGLFKYNDKGNSTLISQDEVILYVNDLKTNNNQFTVTTKDSSLKIGIELLKNTPNGRNACFFKNIKSTNIDRIDNIEINSKNDGDYILKFYVKNNQITNPLKMLMLYIILALLTILFIWKLLLQRIIYPTFKSGMITIQGQDYYNIKLKGARMLVFSSKNEKQTKINFFFTGKIIYKKAPFWSQSWVISPQKGNKIRASGSNFLLDPYSIYINKGEEYTLKNIATEQKIIITYI